MKDLYEENLMLKAAIREVVNKFSPEANRGHRERLVQDFIVSMTTLASLTGVYPPPETMKAYVSMLKEELEKVEPNPD